MSYGVAACFELSEGALDLAAGGVEVCGQERACEVGGGEGAVGVLEFGGDAFAEHGRFGGGCMHTHIQRWVC